MKTKYKKPEIKIVEVHFEAGFSFSNHMTERFKDSQSSGEDFWGPYAPERQGTESFGDSDWNW